MTEVRPFKALLYNEEKVPRIEDVVTPPYDVISGEEQCAFYDRHPYSIIRLDKCREEEVDGKKLTSQQGAARHLQQWLDEGVLVRDEKPAYYLSAAEFPLNGRTVTRYGLIARVRIQEYDKGAVLPHEQTHSKTKTERLELMKACQANFSCIFSLYQDKQSVIDELKAFAAKEKPFIGHVDDLGHRHKVWRITDETMCERISSALAEEKLYIADGHHRYETAINYLNHLRETGNIGEDHPANFVMMYLSSMQDPGLVILPTHRLIKSVDDQRMERLQKELAEYFDITEFSATNGNAAEARENLLKAMDEGAEGTGNVIGMCIKGDNTFRALSLKPGIMDKVFADEMEKPLKRLDVSVLTSLVLERIMGMSHAELGDRDLFAYTSDSDEAIQTVENGEREICFLLNPATNEQVCEVASSGLTMPHKTTFYYPKVVTGHVMNLLKA
ncbi:MAG: DUF1015 domain-containing protein [Desulfatibacillaceae bacterium]